MTTCSSRSKTNTRSTRELLNNIIEAEPPFQWSDNTGEGILKAVEGMETKIMLKRLLQKNDPKYRYSKLDIIKARDRAKEILERSDTIIELLQLIRSQKEG